MASPRHATSEHTLPGDGRVVDVDEKLLPGIRRLNELGFTTVEIAVLGRNGLDINDPDAKYTLKSLPGTFSGLHLVAIMFTAFRQIDPTMETGADFSAEYQAALEVPSA